MSDYEPTSESLCRHIWCRGLLSEGTFPPSDCSSGHDASGNFCHRAEPPGGSFLFDKKRKSQTTNRPRGLRGVPWFGGQRSGHSPLVCNVIRNAGRACQVGLRGPHAFPLSARRQPVSKPLVEPRCCWLCRRLFTATRIDAEFCSKACRQAAYRRRKAAKLNG